MPYEDISSNARDCGIQFLNNRTFSIVLPLNSPSRINELVTSWYDPCNTMPLQYEILARSSATSPWVSVLQRITGGKTPCTTVPGDRDTVGICVDYFRDSIDVTDVKITVLDVDQLDLGSLLYEISVFGVELGMDCFFGGKIFLI